MNLFFQKRVFPDGPYFTIVRDPNVIGVKDLTRFNKKLTEEQKAEMIRTGKPYNAHKP